MCCNEIMVQHLETTVSDSAPSTLLLLMDLSGGEPQLGHKLILVARLNRYKSLLAVSSG